MHRSIIAAAALLSCAVPAHAAPSDVNAQAFYTDALALQKKGMGAMFDKRTRPMMAQLQDAGRRVNAENNAAKEAGRPIYCVPADTKPSMTPQQVIALIGSVPEAERHSSTLRDTWKQAMARRFPCR